MKTKWPNTTPVIDKKSFIGLGKLLGISRNGPRSENGYGLWRLLSENRVLRIYMYSS